MPELKFQRKLAIVTGAGQGIGFEICRQLAREGATVVLNDIDETLTARATQMIRKEGGDCHPHAGDCSNVDFIREMVRTVTTRFGDLRVAVANAGITLFGDFFSYEPDAFFKVMELNLGGTFFLAQAAAVQMKKQEKGGSILLMSSVTGHQAHKNLAAYGMTKAAIEMLARNLVVELSPHHININAIAPGATLTERTLGDAEYERTWSRITPMGRPAKVDDIAAAALFLLSEEARHITGQTIIVDGGWTTVSPSPY
jgi:NAD(P)-dependent dehydrogenase (short-subunit alcohol dehydrogenase family)